MQPKHQNKAQPKQPAQPRIRWSCHVLVRGRLRRSAPSDTGRRKLYLKATDGAAWEVASLGSRKEALGTFLLAHVQECFNTDNIWSCYPASRDRTTTVTLNGCWLQPDPPEGRVLDALQFTGTLKHRHEDWLSIFIGRNQGKGFHFVELQIPQGFKLPSNLKEHQPVRGVARRRGASFALSKLQIAKSL